MSKTKDTQITKKRILEVALDLFSKKGFLGATTKEIAKEADVAEITLFRHFESKEKLFEEVINTYSFLPELKGLLPVITEMPYEDALATIAKKFLETLTLRKDIVRIMQLEISRYPEEAQKIYHSLVDEVIRTLASYFEELQRRGLLIEFDASLIAQAFLGMFFSYFNAQEFKMRKKFKVDDTERIIKEYVKLFVRGTSKAIDNENKMEDEK